MTGQLRYNSLTQTPKGSSTEVTSRKGVGNILTYLTEAQLAVDLSLITGRLHLALVVIILGGGILTYCYMSGNIGKPNYLISIFFALGIILVPVGYGALVAVVQNRFIKRTSPDDLDPVVGCNPRHRLLSPAILEILKSQN